MIKLQNSSTQTSSQHHHYATINHIQSSNT